MVGMGAARSGATETVATAIAGVGLDRPPDAFISYRRGDGKALARWLRHRLQSFRVPPEVLKKLPQEKQDLHARRPRIWLDTAYEKSSDNFLTKKIFLALDRSRRLIVISTPSAFETLQKKVGEAEPNWLMREVDRFLGPSVAGIGARPVDVVLGPGAPPGRYPGRLAERTQWDWTDLRSFTRWRSLGFSEKLDEGLTKIVAALYDVPDDDLPALRREQWRRRLKLMATIGTMAAFVATAMAVLAGLAIWQANVAERRASELRKAASASDFRMGVQRVRAGRLDEGIAHLSRAVRVDPDNRAAVDMLAPILERTPFPSPSSVIATEVDHLYQDLSGDCVLLHSKNGRWTGWCATGTGYPWTFDDKSIRDVRAGVGRMYVRMSDGGLARIDLTRKSREQIKAPGAVPKVFDIDVRSERLAIAQDDAVGIAPIASVDPCELRLEHPDTVEEIAFTPSGRYLVTTAGTALVYWEAGGKRVDKRSAGDDGGVEWFAGPGDLACLVRTRGEIGWQQAWEGRLTCRNPGKAVVIRDEATLGSYDRRHVSHSHDLLAAIVDAERIRVLGAGKKAIEVESRDVAQAEVTSDGLFVLGVVEEGAVRLWRVADGRPVGVPMVLSRPVRRAAMLAGRILVTVDEEGQAVVWTSVAWAPEPSAVPKPAPAPAWYPGHWSDGRAGNFILQEVEDGVWEVRDRQTKVVRAKWEHKLPSDLQERRETQIMEGPVATGWWDTIEEVGGISRDGRTAVTIASNDQPHVWDVVTGQRRFLLPAAGKGLNALSIALDDRGARAVAVYEVTPGRHGITEGTHAYRALDLETPTAMVRLRLLQPRQKVLAVSADADHLLLARDRIIQIVNARSGQMLAEINAGDEVIRGAFAPDGKTFAALTAASIVRVFDTPSGLRVISDLVLSPPLPKNWRGDLDGSNLQVGHLFFSPDGRDLALKPDFDMAKSDDVVVWRVNAAVLPKDAALLPDRAERMAGARFDRDGLLERLPRLLPNERPADAGRDTAQSALGQLLQRMASIFTGDGARSQDGPRP